jgi:signal transduction histidine kinase
LTTLIRPLGWFFLPWTEEILTTVFNGWLALMVVNPLAIMAFGSLILWDEQVRETDREDRDDEARFQTVLDHLPLFLAIRSLDGPLALLNRRYQDLFGPEIMGFVGRPCPELRAYLMPPDYEAMAREDEAKLLQTGQPVSRYLLDIDMRGQERSLCLITFGIHDADRVLRSIGTIGVDLTELRDREKQAVLLEAELMQTAKMEAISQLSRGVAHDFNNLLVGIMGFAGFLKDDLADRPAVRRYAERILTICERAKSLVQQVETVGGAERIERQPIDMHDVLNEARDVLRSRLPPTTELVFNLGGDFACVLANDDQMSRLIVNLCINASDALNGAPGRVTVRLTRVAVTPDIIDARFAPAPTRRVSGTPPLASELICVEVCDTGSGMDQQTLAQMMEPFFTTKGRREGTGLGLWIVDGIMHVYRGYYVVDSEVGAGTTFALYLPQEGEMQPVPPAPAVSDDPMPANVSGVERVLVVDDQQDVLDVFAIGLRRLGFEISAFSDPLTALEQFRRKPEFWDVVVTDQLMPGMRGTELLAQLRQLRPGVRTIVCSGFAEFANDTPIALDHIDLALSKPIEPAALAGHIRALLDGKVPA